MNTKNNQRYQEMDACMKTAMLMLMKEMDFEKITVKNICERAGVNRGTFYSHYVDIFSMMDEIEAASSENLIVIVEEWCSKEENKNLSPFIPYLQYIKENRLLYQNVFANLKKFEVRKSFQPLCERLIKPQCMKAGIEDEYEINCYVIYFQAGITILLRYWLETGCKKDEYEMSELLMNCIPNIRPYI